MSLIWKDRVAEVSTTTGTGAFTLAGALTSYRAFSSVCATSDTVYYVITAVGNGGEPTGDWETGLGTYSAANTLTRTTVLDSSNAGAAVNFGAGTKRVVLSRIANTPEGRWDLVSSTSPSAVASVDVTGLANYSEVLVIARALTATIAGVRAVRVSTDNGSSWDTTNANYLSVSTNGVESNAATAAIGFHSVNTTSARTFACHILNLKGAVKFAESIQGTSTAQVIYVGSDDINAVQIYNVAGGTISGGPILVLAR